jgi:DNA-binding NarL/FixJ family response regulator
MAYRFLVVDDTTFMRKMAADCLTQQGHDVLGEAVNGREAVKMYKELKPDIVMMDLTMPEMSGLEAIKEILAYDPDALILICSASNQEDLILEALDAGAKGYLMKPFNPDRLEEVIRQYADPYLSAQAEEELDEEEEAAPPVETLEQGTVEPPAAVPPAATPAVAISYPSSIPIPAAFQTAAAASSPSPAPIRSDKLRAFTSSFMCNWQEDTFSGTNHYAVVCTESENKILIEMQDDATMEKRSIHLSLDGFRQLSDWLEHQLASRMPAVRGLAKAE